MKARLIFLVLLISCHSCGTNEPDPQSQEEKIIGEVKEIVKTIMKCAQEANFGLVMGAWLYSPGYCLNFDEFSLIHQSNENRRSLVMALHGFLSC